MFSEQIILCFTDVAQNDLLIVMLVFLVFSWLPVSTSERKIGLIRTGHSNQFIDLETNVDSQWENVKRLSHLLAISTSFALL